MKRIQILGLYLFFLCFYLEGKNNNNSYVYLHDSLYNIAQCIDDLNALDDNTSSSVHTLARHIKNGDVVALRDEVIQVLEYALWLLEQKHPALDSSKHSKLVLFIDGLVQAVEHDFLRADVNDNNKKELQSFLDDIQINGSNELETSITRLNVNTNLTLSNSVSKEIGNIMKKRTENGVVSVERFIHNYGIDNVFVGLRSGNFSMTDVAINNTAVGADSLRFNVSGFRNAAMGKDALRNNRTGMRNVGVGCRVLGNAQTSNENTAIGDSAMFDIVPQLESRQNVVVGRNALRGLVVGNNNIAVGKSAGQSLEGSYEASDNIFIGSEAGSSISPGFNNLYIGYKAGSLSVGGNNNIYIGTQGVSSDSFSIRIGQDQTKCFILGIYGKAVAGAAVLINANGQLGVMQSSRNSQDTINQINDESERIYNLNPVSFIYKNDESATKQYGLIAEDVDYLYPNLVVKDQNDAPCGVRYAQLPVLLLNEIKKQKQVMQQREEDIQQQRKGIDTLLCVIHDLQKKVQYYMAA